MELLCYCKREKATVYPMLANIMYSTCLPTLSAESTDSLHPSSILFCTIKIMGQQSHSTLSNVNSNYAMGTRLQMQSQPLPLNSCRPSRAHPLHSNHLLMHRWLLGKGRWLQNQSSGSKALHNVCVHVHGHPI